MTADLFIQSLKFTVHEFEIVNNNSYNKYNKVTLKVEGVVVLQCKSWQHSLLYNIETDQKASLYSKTFVLQTESENTPAAELKEGFVSHMQDPGPTPSPVCVKCIATNQQTQL